MRDNNTIQVVRCWAAGAKNQAKTTMGEVVGFRGRHVGARTDETCSQGYKSGRSSCRDTPDIRSTSSTLSGGTSSHWPTACAVTPIRSASAFLLPSASMARFNAVFASFMAERNKSISLVGSQAMIRCTDEASLYRDVMSVGERIRAARKRLKMTRRELAAGFNITEQAIYEWEAKNKRPDFEKLPGLARALKVPLTWLIEGKGPPPPPDDARVRIEELSPEQKEMLEQFLRFLESTKKSGAA